MSDPTKNDDDIDIEIVDNPAEEDEAPAEGKKAEATAAPAADAGKPATADAGIDDLKRQLSEKEAEALNERNARIAALRERDQIAERSRSEVEQSHYSVISNAMEAVQTAIDKAKGDLKAAWTEGDFDKAANLQAEISEKAAELVTLRAGKSQLEQQRKQPPRQPEQRQQAQPADPYASFTPRTADWLRKHPEYLSDKTKNLKIVAAHNMAVADGHVPDSDSYFDYCEKFVGLKSEPAKEEEQAPAPRARAMPSAPVSGRSVSTSTGQPAGRITLTKDEADFAKANWPNLSPADAYKEYAKNKRQLAAEGRMGAN